MSAIAVLSAHGTLRAALVVELAQAAGLELACAAVVLEKESAGGRNLWGHDGVQTGNAYVKGSEVTRSAYLAYKQAVAAGRAGRQGVGPCQLTYGPLQEQADKAGGCWDPAANMRVGFAHLAGLIRAHGLHDGFRRYNGSGPAALAYANDAMHRLGIWRGRLAGAPVASPSGAGTPATLKQGDVGPAVERLQIWLNASYPAYSKLDTKPRRYGPQTVSAIREFQRRSGVTGSDANGTVIGPRTWAALLAAGYRP